MGRDDERVAHRVAAPQLECLDRRIIRTPLRVLLQDLSNDVALMVFRGSEWVLPRPNQFINGRECAGLEKIVIGTRHCRSRGHDRGLSNQWLRGSESSAPASFPSPRWSISVQIAVRRFP